MGYNGILHFVYKIQMISERYAALCANRSDINEHLPTLARHASECNHVTECGVRTALSSYAFGHALKDKPNARLVQVDVNRSPEIDEFQEACSCEGLSSVFHEMSDLDCPMEETDLLFIDTWHVYGQLKRELARWHSRVRKYIILHDTEVDGIYGETIRCNMNAIQQSKDTGIPIDEIRRGLKPALYEFLNTHPQWVVYEHFANNNGLTVLTRRT